MRRSAFVLIVALLAAVPASADTPQRAVPLTFYQALHRASKRSPSVILADEKVRQALEDLSKARSRLLPHADISASWSRQTRNLSTMGIPLPSAARSVTPAFESVDARVRLNQVIFDPAALKRLDAAADGKRLSAAELKKARQDAMALVGALYIDAERAQEALVSAGTVLRLRLEQKRLAQLKNRRGSASDLELKRAVSALADARYARHAAASSFAAALLDLKTALGIPPSKRIRLAGAHRAAMLPSLRRPDPEALKRHPDIQAAAAEGEMRRSEEAAAWSELWPKISGTADYGENGGEIKTTEPTYFLGLQFTWPVFDAGERVADASAAASRRRSSAVKFRDLLRKTRAGTAEAVDGFKDARVLYAAKRDSLLQKESEWDSVRLRVRNGAASRIELAEAAAQTAVASDQLAEAAAFCRTAAIRLAHASGDMETLVRLKGI